MEQKKEKTKQNDNYTSKEAVIESSNENNIHMLPIVSTFPRKGKLNSNDKKEYLLPIFSVLPIGSIETLKLFLAPLRS